MKNVPHQFSELGKLLACLRVFADLAGQNADLGDFAVGVELVRRGLYAFRNRPVDIEAKLHDEMRKEPQNRGFQTCARDLRRLYELLGFMSQGLLTDLGKQVLAEGAEATNPVVRRLWHNALWNLRVEDSHPYRIMLRLVREIDGIHGNLLSLALVPTDDSDAAFSRVKQLAQLDNEGLIVQRLRVSQNKFNNARKVIASLALQIGDITHTTPGGTYLTRQGAAGIIAPPEAPKPVHAVASDRASTARLATRHRSVTAENLAPYHPTDEPNAYANIIDTGAGSIRRVERAGRHNELTQQWGYRLSQLSYELLEAPYDCLAVAGDAILTETKTLNGRFDTDDERAQVRHALAQLLYYEALDLPPTCPSVVKVALFELEISEAHKHLLERHGCLVVWSVGDGFTGTPLAMAHPSLSRILLPITTVDPAI